MRFCFFHTRLLVIFAFTICNGVSQIEHASSRKVLEDVSLKQVQYKGIRAPFLPPLPDPLPIPDGNRTLNLTTEILELTGPLFNEQTSLSGLSGLMNDIKANEKLEEGEQLVLLNVTIRIEELFLTTLHEIDVILQAALEGFRLWFNFVGDRELNIKIANLTFGTNLAIRIVNESIVVTAESLELDMSLLEISGDNFIIYNEDGEWDYKENFLPFLKTVLPMVYPTLLPLISASWTELLQECTLNQLVEEDFNCLYPSPTPTEGTTQEIPPSTPTTTAPTTERVECTDDTFCRVGQYCEVTEARCRCRDRVFSVELGYPIQCRLIAGSSCLLSVEDLNFIPCVDNSICNPINSTLGRCECQIGSVETETGSCELNFGQSCDYNYKNQCYKGYILDCQNRRCACASPALEYISGYGCVAPLGGRCGITYDIQDGYSIQCSPGLVCNTNKFCATP